MNTPQDRRAHPVLWLIALLLLANLLQSSFLGPTGPAILPTADAQPNRNEGLVPLRRTAFQGASLVTNSADGSVLYVWNTEVINGEVRASGSAFSTGR